MADRIFSADIWFTRIYAWSRKSD